MRSVNELSKNAITLSPTSSSKHSVQDGLRGREEAGRLPGERRGAVRGDGPSSFYSPAETLHAEYANASSKAGSSSISNDRW